MKDLYADYVRRACFRYVQNREEADDLAQEVLLKVASSGAGFSGGSCTSAWLYRVTANHCLDHLRREKRLRSQVESYVAERWSEDRQDAKHPVDPWKPPPPDAVKNERSRQVLERLRVRSGATDRHVIYLRFDLGLSHSGIAEILGVSRTAVGQRLSRIHARATHLWQHL